MRQPRRVRKVIQSRGQKEGGGVTVFRSIGGRELDHVDPFLLLDEMKSDDPKEYIAGFPDHPHRGFETLTYMIQGEMIHMDSQGNREVLSSGGAQWITAGKGIVHSEIPKQERGLLWGFQLWINLPAERKMCQPDYRSFSAEEMPVCVHNKAEIKIIAGDFQGTRGPVKGIGADPAVFDITLKPNSRIRLEPEREENTLLYLLEGGVCFINGQEPLESFETPGTLVCFEKGDYLEVAARDLNTRFLYLSAKPIGEPVARYGPFVMNNMSEIEKAFRDYETGQF
ncbi:MAG: pirin family protein [Deltaproteobacteria bacterium]|nr:pirin family protein [Deltaproteobacteria bacterium]